MKRVNVVLGNLAKDMITGYTGIVVAITNWFNGCCRITLQSQEMKDGKPIDSYCIDAEQVQLVGVGLADEKRTPSGGPQPSPTRNSDPSR